MLAKIWKKLALLILILACIFNVMNKLVHKVSLDKEMVYSAEYMMQQEENNTNNTWKKYKIMILY